LKNQERLTKVGTPFYEAPESTYPSALPPFSFSPFLLFSLMQNLTPFLVVKGNYNERVDSYSFGKMVYEIVTKSLSPATLANRDFYDRFTLDQVSSQLEGLAEEFRHLIVACCQPLPHGRPDFEVLSKYLYDYYLQFTSHN
jgi:serine/threonine protein kinase